MKPIAFLPAVLVLPLLACSGGAAGTDADTGSTDSFYPAQSANDAGTRSRIDGGASTTPADEPETSVPPAPPSCVGSLLPTDDACVVHESFGVFVSSRTGSAKGSGTSAAPLASLAAAIAMAKQSHRRVYACADTFRESVAIEDGVAMFGYFDCAAGWKVGAHSAVVASPVSPAVTAIDVKTPTRIEAFDFESADASLPGATSIAMRAVRASGLTLVDVGLAAGDGARGADGTAAVQLVQAGPIHGAPALRSMSQVACFRSYGGAGCAGRYGTNVAAGVSQCVGSAGFDGGPGGAGGHPGLYAVNEFGFVLPTIESEMGKPAIATPQTAAGGAPVTAAQNGSVGAAGSDGASAVGLGAFSAMGYAVASGTAGTHGAPGQGGGGGRPAPADPDVVKASLSPWYGASGSGGGAGGCPGLAGTPGQGGGASIALLAFDSPMVLERCVLRSKRGGDGGKGSLGSEPTAGGAAGLPAHADPLTTGGRGGSGGRAGVSGNGSGGPSIGIAVHGASSALTQTTVVAGTPGNGQPALVAANRNVAASPAGLSLTTHLF